LTALEEAGFLCAFGRLFVVVGFGLLFGVVLLWEVDVEGLFCGLRGRVDAWLGRLTAVEEQCRGRKFAGHSGWSGGKDVLLIVGSIVLRRFGIGVVAGLEGGSVKDGFFLRCSGFRG